MKLTVAFAQHDVCHPVYVLQIAIGFYSSVSGTVLKKVHMQSSIEDLRWIFPLHCVQSIRSNFECLHSITSP